MQGAPINMSGFYGHRGRSSAPPCAPLPIALLAALRAGRFLLGLLAVKMSLEPLSPAGRAAGPLPVGSRAASAPAPRRRRDHDAVTRPAHGLLLLVHCFGLLIAF